LEVLKRATFSFISVKWTLKHQLKFWKEFSFLFKKKTEIVRNYFWKDHQKPRVLAFLSFGIYSLWDLVFCISFLRVKIEEPPKLNLKSQIGEFCFGSSTKHFLPGAFKLIHENQRENDMVSSDVIFAFLVCSYYKPHQVAKVRSL